jgi:cytochrome c biogenesis protein CcmG/thiol:disulfide interchange protein DsbE
MTRPLRLTVQSLALAAVLGLLALLIWRVTDSGARPTKGPAPGFRLPRIDVEGHLSLASLRGKGVVVNFWASWCIPCKEEAPVLEQTWRRHRDEGLVVLGVDAQDFKGDARAFMRKHGVSYPVVHDGKGSTLGRWGVTGFPETFCVDRRGRLVGEKIDGGVDVARNVERFERCVRLALRR